MAAPPRPRYERLVRQMQRRYGLRVHRWRAKTTGCAWEVHYDNGNVTRLIESPYPKTPISAAVFLHEVGHHAIGFHRYKPRCLEEYMAWRWALRAMRENGIKVDARVKKRVEMSLRYAVSKAKRRGLKRLPVVLLKYLTK